MSARGMDPGKGAPHMKAHLLSVASMLTLFACGDSDSSDGSGAGGAGPGPDMTTTTGTSGPTGATTTSSASSSSSSNASTSTGMMGEIEVSNVPADCPASSILAVSPILPDEAGHYAATRLTPPAYPFSVTSIEYDLVQPPGNVQCANQGFEHEVQIYIATDTAPPATPEAPVLWDTFPMPPSDPETHTNEISFADPIQLTAGQHLYVSVQLVGEGEESLCIASCAETSTAEVDYWSNAAAVPFAWADMVEDFGFALNFTTRMYGTAE